MPSKPLNARKVSSTTGIISIEWDLPESDGDSQILDYEVWWDDGAEDANYDIIGTSTGNGLTFTTSSTLIAGNTYSFLIRAKNLVGDGAYSDILTIIAGTFFRRERILGGILFLAGTYFWREPSQVKLRLLRNIQHQLIRSRSDGMPQVTEAQRSQTTRYSGTVVLAMSSISTRATLLGT